MIYPYCRYWNCEIRQGNHCCFYCHKKDTCLRKCKNTPDKCGGVSKVLLQYYKVGGGKK